MKLLRAKAGWITFFLVATIPATFLSTLHSFYLEKSLSSLQQPYSSKIFISLKTGELLFRDIIRGEFKAKENNLGI